MNYIRQIQNRFTEVFNKRFDLLKLFIILNDANLNKVNYKIQNKINIKTFYKNYMFSPYFSNKIHFLIKNHKYGQVKKKFCTK